MFCRRGNTCRAQRGSTAVHTVRRPERACSTCILQSAHAGAARASSLYRMCDFSRCGDATSGVHTFKRPFTQSELVFFGDDVSLLHIMDLVHEDEKLHCNAHARFVCFHELSPRCLRSYRVLGSGVRPLIWHACRKRASKERERRRLVALKECVRSSETLATVRCLISACTRLPSKVVHCNRCLHTTTYNVSTANAERRGGLKVGAHTKALSVSVSSVVSKRLYGCSRGLVCRVARRASDAPRARRAPDVPVTVNLGPPAPHNAPPPAQTHA